MSDHLRDRLTAAVGDHYLIEGELGRGGMAAVYRALDVRLNRRVAIKLLPPELAFNPHVRSRFLREAQMAAGLAHPNIVPIYTVDEVEGVVFFVMAYVDGDSLKSLLSGIGALPAERVRTIVSEVADALDYAHRQGVVHRDIKPDNILVERNTGRAVVTDFGIARAAAEEQRLTVTGMAVGTPAYMSPEQAMGERDVDGRTDIYSLGIVAYQMLAGETPFKASNTPAMLMKHVSETPPSLLDKRPDLPHDLVGAVERSLAKRPEDRWETAAGFRDAVLGRNPVPAVAPQRPAPREAPLDPLRADPPRALAPQRPRLPGYPPPLPRPHDARERGRDARDQLLDARDELLDVRDRVHRTRELRDRIRREAEGTTPEERIASFRRRFAVYLASSLMLFGINAAMGGFPWFIFPVLGMGVGIVKRLGAFWGDGIPLRRVFFGANKRAQAPVDRLLAVESSMPDPATLAPREVLEGIHGAAIKRAAASKGVVTDILKRMTANERKMLPADIEATVNALVERVASVAITLHRLDSAANGSTLGSLDERILSLKEAPESSERERRLSLLERQRATLADLLERRQALLSQLESASLALENLKLDLVRFRSAGVSTALEDVTSATREARAVSRDIGHLLDAADEVRKL